MKSILASITAIWVSYQLAIQVCAQQITTLAPPLTHIEQARLLGLVTSKGESLPLLPISPSDYHIAQAKSLLNEMDRLIPDGTRRGNPLLKQVLFHLESARRSGASYESSLEEIYRSSSKVPALIQDREEQILEDMKTCRQLGLLTSENMERLKQGLAPVVTRGNAKYIGEPVEVDHRVPIRDPNGRPVYENDPANMQLLPKSINREKWANIDDISLAHKAKLDRAYWAEQNTITGGVMASGFGLLMLYTSGSALLADYNAPHDDFIGVLQIGENATLFVSGAAMTTVGLSEIGSRIITSDRALSIFYNVTKWGERTTLVGIIIAEPIALGLDCYYWDEMTTSQRIFSMAQHGINIGTGVYATYRVVKAYRAAKTLGSGLELAGEEEAAGGGPEDPVADAVAVATLGATIVVTVGQYTYDYFHPILPSWNSSAFTCMDESQMRQVEASIYEHYKVAH